MSGPLIVVVMLIYALVGVDQARKGDWPMALVWMSYAQANIGFYLSLK